MRSAVNTGVLLCSLLVPLAAASAQAGAADDARVQQWLGSVLPRYLQLYRELHQQPELSRQERKTAARAASELRAAGYKVTTGVGGHGVVAVLENGPGAVHAAFFDIDWQAETPGLAGRVLVPVLGNQYGIVLEDGDLRMRAQLFSEDGREMVEDRAVFDCGDDGTPAELARKLLAEAPESIRRLFAAG